MSDSLTIAGDEPWASSTTVIPRREAHETVQELLNGHGGTSWCSGSRTVWNNLLTTGLVTELHLLVGPKLLGGGVPMFTGPPTALHLAEVRRLEASSLVLHRYLAAEQ